METKIQLDNNLYELAKIFKKCGATLYIVGGYVRNSILHFCETDIDICSSLVPEEVFKVLYNSQFSCKLVNESLGTIHIYDKNSNGVFYEHTTFRAEQYTQGGTHSPQCVKFVNDIKQDASRRDFTANALYYDILKGEILDFYEGISDVNSHILRTVETPQSVFACDGLRILRMVRIACELGFEIAEETYKTAKNMVSQLKDISQERFNKEIISILFSDFKYKTLKTEFAYLRGIQILTDLGAWQFVLKDFWDKLSNQQREILSTMQWKMLSQASPVLRISCLVCDLISELNLEATPEIINSILGVKGIMLSKKECARQQKIVSGFLKIKLGEVKNDFASRIFLQENNEYLCEILGLCKIADIGANVIRVYELVKIDKVPLTLKELAINGNDLEEIYPELPKNCYSKVLKELLRQCAIMPELNKKEALLFTVPDAFLQLQD